jgi:hypothetical protein
MNDLHAWLLQQHHGLRTCQIFQQKLATLSGDEPEKRALCRLLSYLVASYIEAFDEDPLPVAIADRAYQRLLDLVASLDDGKTRVTFWCSTTRDKHASCTIVGGSRNLLTARTSTLNRLYVVFIPEGRLPHRILVSIKQ